MPTTTRNITATKSCTAPFKKETCLAMLCRQSCNNFSDCQGHHFEPRCFRFFYWFWPRCKSGGKLQKIRQKAEKANFTRVEYKKILDAIRFHLRGEPFNEKDFLGKLKMVDDFISDHCMDIPAKLDAKYRKRSAVV